MKTSSRKSWHVACAIVVSVWLFAGCGDKQRGEVPPTSQVFEKVNRPTASITFDAEEGKILELASGTVINIPADAFDARG
jgi:uncharacterized protein YcfL